MSTKKLHKSKKNKKLLGVCGGLAEYFEIDATIIRLIVAILAILTSYFGIGFLIYLICAFILPYEED